MKNKIINIALFLIVNLIVFSGCAYKQEAENIIDATGVNGGLVVHLACGDGKLTTALHKNDSYLVQGLDSNPDNVAKARHYILGKDLYGKVTINRFIGDKLPYIDNTANLVVSEYPVKISMDEIMRILAPNGVAYIKKNNVWQKTVKPEPRETDEWTHYLYDASNNAVSRDKFVGPPRRYQWLAGPRWTRSHEHMSSINALVSGGGKIFYVMDEGSRVSVNLPPKWSLIARDAYNGVLLWKRPLPSWHDHRWPLKSGPAQLPRRLVINNNILYIPLGIDAPLSALDAESGDLIQTFEDSKPTEEILISESTIVLLVSDDMVDKQKFEYNISHVWNVGGEAKSRFTWNDRNRSIIALNKMSGNTIWKYESPVVPLSLAANKQSVIFYDGSGIVCLDIRNGKKKWMSENINKRTKELGTAFTPTLVLYENYILFSGGDKILTSLDMENGDILWSSVHPESGHHSPEDVLCIDGLVWSGDIARPNQGSGIFSGRDPQTGKMISEFPIDVDIDWFHHRCYRSKATDKYIIPSATGIEFVDFKTKHWITNHWVRGACLYGIIPSNGLVYAPPHPCACFIEAKLNGFNALAPAPAKSVIPKGDTQSNDIEDKRLESGPAYTPAMSKFNTAVADSWPMYRHDSKRSGYIKSSIPTNLEKKWEVHVGGKLTQPVVAGSQLIVASVNRHTVYALKISGGDILWSYTVGGRIDSSPTILNGNVYFGSADGWVYCLRQQDGVLRWRFRAAPQEKYLVSFGQVESVWPVHGSVLIQDSTLYCVAGRSMFLDGGLRLVQLHPNSGQLISETVLDENDPATGENLQTWVKGLTMPVALSDILSSDEQNIYLRSQKIGLDGSRNIKGRSSPVDQGGEDRHLFVPAGFLDDSWFHRTYWVYGKSSGSGWGNWMNPARYTPSGRILAIGESAVFGYGRTPAFLCQSSIIEYHLFCADKKFDSAAANKIWPFLKEIRKTQGDWIADWQITNANPVGKLTSVNYKWRLLDIPLLVRSMVLSDDLLFIAGPPDLVDEVKGFGRFEDPEYQTLLDKQEAALKGKAGSLLWVVSTVDGKKISEYKLESTPVFDGMIAAKNQIFLAMIDGRIICMGS